MTDPTFDPPGEYQGGVVLTKTLGPGPTDTGMNPENSDWAKGTLPNVALGRYAQPSEIADFVAFLASAEAAYITGASLSADGGYAA